MASVIHRREVQVGRGRTVTAYSFDSTEAPGMMMTLNGDGLSASIHITRDDARAIAAALVAAADAGLPMEVEGVPA
jgi:hypothetical protein